MGAENETVHLEHTLQLVAGWSTARLSSMSTTATSTPSSQSLGNTDLCSAWRGRETSPMGPLSPQACTQVKVKMDVSAESTGQTGTVSGLALMLMCCDLGRGSWPGEDHGKIPLTSVATEGPAKQVVPAITLTHGCQCCLCKQRSLGFKPSVALPPFL